MKKQNCNYDSAGMRGRQSILMPLSYPLTGRIRRRNWLFSQIKGYLYISPWLIVFSILTVYPFIRGIWLSFTDWDGLSKVYKFVGIQNYIKALFDEPLFWRTIYNLTYYWIYVLIGYVVFGMLLALLVNSIKHGKGFFRSAFFMPNITTGVAVSLIWVWLYNTDFGMLNALLGGIGLPPVKWLTNEHIAMLSVAIMSIWKDIGFYMVILLGGLQTIPISLYESARIDGSSKLNTLLKITIPLMNRTIVLVVIIVTIGAFQIFDQAYVMTGGGPFESTTTLTMLVYKFGFSYFKMGYGSAIAVLLSLIIFIFSMIQKKIVEKDFDY